MCEYCKVRGKPLFHADDSCEYETVKISGTRLTLSIVDKHYGGAFQDVDINYCPMCGRKLMENNNEDL